METCLLVLTFSLLTRPQFLLPHADDRYPVKLKARLRLLNMLRVLRRRLAPNRMI